MKIELKEIIFDIIGKVTILLIADRIRKTKWRTIAKGLLKTMSSIRPSITVARHKTEQLFNHGLGEISCYLRSRGHRMNILGEVRQVAFSTLIGAMSCCFLCFSFFIAYSYQRGINERTFQECVAGFVFCLFSAWFVNWYFHRLYRA